MINNIFNQAVRHLLNNQFYSFVIIICLSIAFSFSNILITFLFYEYKTDSHHKDIDQIYRLKSTNPFGQDEKISHIGNQTTQYLASNYTEIQNYCRIDNLKGVRLIKEDVEFNNLILITVDTSFFDIFNFSFDQGTPNGSIRDKGIILTRRVAQKLGYTLNQDVTIKDGDNTNILEVTGVINESQENSHLKFDGIVLFGSTKKQWGGNCYIKLIDKAGSADKLSAKINADDQVPSLIGPGALDYFLQPLREIYYDNNKNEFLYSRDKHLLYVSAIAIIIILFIASFNFLNLVLISMIDRKKSIGIQKVYGISKTSIALSAFVEISLYIITAIIISIILLYTFLPYSNQVFQTHLKFNDFLQWPTILILGVCIGTVGFVLILCLTHYLGKIKALDLISFRSDLKLKINKTILFAQFFITAGLIICSAIIIKQIKFIEKAPIGFNRNIIELELSEEEKKKGLLLLKQELLSIPELDNIAISSGNPISGNWKVRYDLGNNASYSPYLLTGDKDLLKTLKLEIINGSPLSETDKDGVLVNESFVKFFSMADPIGASIPGTQNEYIKGVIKDFRSVSLKDEIVPYIISYNENVNFLLVDYDNQDLNFLLPKIEDSWKKIFPEETFTYSLINEELRSKHKSDFELYRLIIAFTFASIFISCFGLFALSWGYSRSRTKEIGIRKLVGANSFQIFTILFKQFAFWIGLSFLIAVPFGYWLTQKWLQNFTYKTDVEWWIFALAGAFLLVITLISVSFHTLKAALNHPINSLRHE